MSSKENPIEVVTPEMLPLIYTAIDASSTGVIITDNRLPDNPIIYSNKAFERITGYCHDEIAGRNCRFLQSHEQDQPARSLIAEAIKKGEHVTVEIKNYRKNGELFWNELSISPVKNENGDITHFIGVQNDITRRKEAEVQLESERQRIEEKVKQRTEHLRQNEEYLNSVIQTIRESLLVLDPNLRVLTVNKSFLRTFKVSTTETIGRRLFELGNRQWDIDDLRKLLETILPTNNPVLDFEVEHDFPHIGKKTMLLNAHRIELEGQYKDRILLAIDDITDRRSIEKRKDDFLSIASHELKTPLTALKGYIQLAKKFLPNDNNRLVEIVQKSDIQIERLNKLMVELLEVSKIQSGKLDVHHNKFDFSKMVRDAIEQLQFNTDQHRIFFTGAHQINYNGDETKLNQVVANLISNAIKYSPEADRVDIHLAHLGGHIKLSVKDYGLGIAHEDRTKIFERFYRVSDIKEKIAGMGIGLYVCQEIIKQHNGKLWVDSEIGQGSTFSFILPNTE
jgi:PAS domain S-box-containing protein